VFSLRQVNKDVYNRVKRDNYKAKNKKGGKLVEGLGSPETVSPFRFCDKLKPFTEVFS
jgi:hypothetical protein